MTCATATARSELVHVELPWLFAIDLVRPTPVWEEVVGADGDHEEVLTAPPDARWAAPWFAEARGHGLATTRAGMLHLDGELVVETRRFAPRDHPVTRHFHRLLFRHPARRRFPLRGR